MEIITYMFLWLPSPYKEIVLGIIAIMALVGIVKLIGAIWEMIPFT